MGVPWSAHHSGPIGGSHPADEWTAACAVHPHLLMSGTLTLRSGRRTVLEVDRELIVRASPTRRFGHTDRGIHDGRLYLPGPDGTVVDIDFDTAVSVEDRSRAGAQTVS